MGWVGLYWPVVHLAHLRNVVYCLCHVATCIVVLYFPFPVPCASCVSAAVLRVIFHFACLHLLHARLMSTRHLVHMLSPCFVHVLHHFSCGPLSIHALHTARAVMAQVSHARSDRVCSHFSVHSWCRASVIVCRCRRVSAVLFPLLAVARRPVFACSRASLSCSSWYRAWAFLCCTVCCACFLVC